MSSERKRKGKEAATAPKAPPPEPVTAKFDLGNGRRPLCAPLQQKIGDVPILHFNLAASDFLAEYIRVIDLTLTRAEAIAPATLLGRAITPIANPCNRPKPYPKNWDFRDGNSHYIIEMRCTQTKNGKFIKLLDGMRVRILFCDYNGYQIGFSRYLDGEWSVWYYCSDDFPLPFFLRKDAIKLPFEGDYTSMPDIGGQETFVNIFRRFGKYPEERSRDFERVFLASAVVFCEVRRIVWIYLEVRRRILDKQPPYPLDCNLPGRERTQEMAWTEITDWGTDCSDALKAVKDGEYIANTPENGYTTKARPVIMSFGELISLDKESGHLGLLMRDDRILAPNGCPLLSKLEKKGLTLGPQVADPGFPDDPTPHENREDGGSL